MSAPNCDRPKRASPNCTMAAAQANESESTSWRTKRPDCEPLRSLSWVINNPSYRWPDRRRYCTTTVPHRVPVPRRPSPPLLLFLSTGLRKSESRRNPRRRQKEKLVDTFADRSSRRHTSKSPPVASRQMCSSPRPPQLSRTGPDTAQTFVTCTRMRQQSQMKSLPSGPPSSGSGFSPPGLVCVVRSDEREHGKTAAT